MRFSRQEYWGGLPFLLQYWVTLWSMWSDWLVFCDCGFQSVYPLMEKDKRLMEASWWDRLTEGETGSCSDGRGHAQFSSVAQSCSTLCNPMGCRTPGFPVHHQLRSLLKLMPSSHFILCYPLLPSIFPSIRVFSNESALHIRWPENWEFQL